MRREVRATANRLANFDDANLRRSARAAVAAAARVQRAMEILGPQIPDHLKEAGELRISHGQAIYCKGICYFSLKRAWF
jgi:DNA-binding protein WhiA